MDAVGEVVVRREWLRGPHEFRYPWAERRAAEMAWETFEAAGWERMEEFGLAPPGPPVALDSIRPTPDGRYFIAAFRLGEGAYNPETGFLVGAGWVGPGGEG